jgi:hypothetical protein
MMDFLSPDARSDPDIGTVSEDVYCSIVYCGEILWEIALFSEI